MPTYLDCDVVVVNFNAGEILSECIGSVLSQGVSKVIVVDNASSDTSIEQLERDTRGEQRLDIVRSSHNIGFSAGCNLGLRRSSARYILFLNPDCIVEEGAIVKLLDTLKENHNVAAVGGLLLNPDGTEQPGGRRVVPTPRRAFIRAFGLSKLGKIFPSLFSDFLLHREPIPKSPIEVEAISGACMLVNRSAMDEVGEWDEEYFMHCEDLDWCMRFRSAGWKILFVPQARLTHYAGSCSKSRPLLVEWYKHKGMVRYYYKHFRHQYSGTLLALVRVAVWVRFVVLIIPVSLRYLFNPAYEAISGKTCRTIHEEVRRN